MSFSNNLDRIHNISMPYKVPVHLTTRFLYFSRVEHEAPILLESGIQCTLLYKNPSFTFGSCIEFHPRLIPKPVGEIGIRPFPSPSHHPTFETLCTPLNIAKPFVKNMFIALWRANLGQFFTSTYTLDCLY